MAKQLPSHIQAAFTVLEDLSETEQKAIKSNLTKHAKELHKAGVNITVELLREHIETGQVRAHVNNANRPKTYDDIVAKFKQDKKQSEQPDLLPGQQNRIQVNVIDPFAPETDAEREAAAKRRAIVDRFDNASKNGDLNTCEDIIAQYGGKKLKGWGDRVSYETLIERCFQYGHFDMLKSIMPKLRKDAHWRFKHKYGHALERGDMEMMRFVCEDLGMAEEIENYYSESPGTMYLKKALKNGHWDAIEYTLPNIFKKLEAGEYLELAIKLLEEACREEKHDSIDRITSWGIKAKVFKYLHLFSSNRNKSLLYLLDHTEFYDADDVESLLEQADPIHDTEMINAIQTSRFAMQPPKLGVTGWLKTFALFLREHLYNESHRSDHQAHHMAQLLRLPKFLYGPYAGEVDRNITGWKRMGVALSGFRMKQSNPERVGKKTFEYAVSLYKQEGLMDDIAHEYAYHTAALFRTPDRILQYLEKWGFDARQPLHDVAYMIKVPQKGDFDAKSWGDAVLQHGPKMAKLVSFADRIPQPLKSEDGSCYSYAKTKSETAKFIYKKASLAHEFAESCHAESYKEAHFNKGLKLIQKYRRKYRASGGKKPENHIPEITIDGSKFGMDGYKFRKLEDGDWKGLLLGAFTDCCQHLGSAGASCAEHGFMSPHGGFYIVESENGEIIGQSWAWRGNNGELVLDSLEHLNGRIQPQNWQQIIENMANHIAKSRPDICELNIGQGGKTPTLEFNGKASAAIPKDYRGYRDSNLQYCAYRSDKSPFASRPKPAPLAA